MPKSTLRADARVTPEATGNPVSRLSFVADRDGKTLPKPKGDQCGRCFSRVRPSGDYANDCKVGLALGLEYLAYAEAEMKSGGPPILGFIVEDMQQKHTGPEVGFLSMVAYAASAGVQRARNIAAY
jgi:hypothetical protein